MKTARFARTGTALALFLGLAATVAFRTSAVGAITVGADQDTWIDGTTRDAVMDEDGTSTVLKVSGSRGPVRARKGYIRFGLSGQPFDADAPATVVVTAASEPDLGSNQLRMFALNDGFEPKAGQLGTDWEAGAIAWRGSCKTPRGIRSGRSPTLHIREDQPVFRIGGTTSVSSGGVLQKPQETSINERIGRLTIQPTSGNLST